MNIETLSFAACFTWLSITLVKGGELLSSIYGTHPKFVFPYKGKQIGKCTNHAWRKALKRAG